MKELYDICVENAPYRNIDLSDKVYSERLKEELETIKYGGFEDYLLIVADMINFAKRQGWYMSSCRGSSGGSCVAYLLGITEVDPIPHNLLFSRFLNKARLDGGISAFMDVDSDIGKTKRGKLIEYIIEKYGIEKVTFIRNYNKFTFNNAFRMVSSAGNFNISYEQINSIMKSTEFKNKDDFSETFDFEEYSDEFDTEEEEMESLIEILNNPNNVTFKNFYEKNKEFRKMCDIASKLIGSVRSFSQHAAGVIIFDEPVSNFAPIALQKKKGDDKRYIVLQADKVDVEMIGGVKIDLLGLKTADVITETLKECGITLKDFSKIDLNESVVYENILSEGKTSGVFTMETEGMKDTLRKIKAHEFNDLAACQALYRPGAMDNIPDYVDVKINGKNIIDIKPEYNSIEHIISETYGVITYQEQAMRIVKEIAGFSDSRADDVRKAIGKKKIDLINECGKEFLEKATIPKKEAEFIWDEIKKSGNYSFNKSHAVGYAMVSFACAYLINYYPAYYFKNLLELSDQKNKIKDYIKNCPVKIKPPDIFKSEFNHTVRENIIYFGLSKIKGVKSKNLLKIENYMKDKTPENFNIMDFIIKNELDKSTFQGLVCAGAFDSLKLRRSVLYSIVKEIMEIFSKEKGKVFQNEDEDYNYSKSLSYFEELTSLDKDEQKKATVKKMIKNGDISINIIEEMTFDEDWKILKRTLNRLSKVAGYRRGTDELLNDFNIIYNSAEKHHSLISSIECLELEKEYIGEVLSIHPDDILKLESKDIKSMSEEEEFEMVAYIDESKERKTKNGNTYYMCNFEFKYFNIISNVFGRRKGKKVEEITKPKVGFYLVTGKTNLYKNRLSLNIDNIEKI